MDDTYKKDFFFSSLKRQTYRKEKGPHVNVGVRAGNVASNPMGMNNAHGNGSRPGGQHYHPRTGMPDPFKYLQLSFIPVKANAQAIVPVCLFCHKQEQWMIESCLSPESVAME